MKSSDKKCGSCTSCRQRDDVADVHPLRHVNVTTREEYERRRKKIVEHRRFRRQVYAWSFLYGTLAISALAILWGVEIWASLLLGLAAGAAFLIPLVVLFKLQPASVSVSIDTEAHLKDIDDQVLCLNRLIDAKFGLGSRLADIEEAAAKWTEEAVHCIEFTVANRETDKATLDLPSRETIRRKYKQLRAGAENCPCFIETVGKKPEWIRWLPAEPAGAALAESTQAPERAIAA